MPSNQDPATVVNPGPGRIPAGVVPAGALVPPGGGGGGGSLAALNAHIHNPIDAHLAHAIGIDPYYPPFIGPTPDPILTSVGGVVDGESVLDFINEFKDLIPPRPNSIGFNLVTGISSGIPNWNALATLLTGGYQQGSNVQFSHYIVPTATAATGAITGLLFPADRGVVAFYKNVSGNFLDAPNTTLVAALSLNDTAPAGIPNSAFNEVLRQGQQLNYTGTGIGLDQFSLTYRLPYLLNYSAYPGTPYGPFSTNFFRYQLAEFSLLSQALGVGDGQDLLIVHWRETFATTLAAIGPTALTLGNLVPSKCYSAVPTSNTPYGAGSWDDNTQAVFNVNRHFIFRDSGSGSSPVGTVFTSAPAGTITTQPLSGVSYYNSTGLEFNVDIRATGLFTNTFQTGSSDNPPHVPTQMHSAFDPIQMDFTNFGGGVFPVPYYVMNKFGGGVYSETNSPAPGDIGEYLNSTLAIYTPAAFMPVGGFAQLTADLRTPFHETTYVDPKKYLLDTYTPGAISTTTYEPFVDELYRYAFAFDPTSTSTVPIIPSSVNVFNSAAALSLGGGNAQVAGHELLYPQTNYTTGFFPNAGEPDYSGFPSGDALNHIRRYQRAVDTGVPRNTGTLRIRGLAYAAFQAVGAYDGTETTGHLGAYPNGGAIIQIKVPGGSGTGWLDLGRAYGDPGIATLDFYGCSTTVTISGPDVIITYNTTAFTSNNGSGNFLLFVRINFINESSANPLFVTEFQWSP